MIKWWRGIWWSCTDKIFCHKLLVHPIPTQPMASYPQVFFISSNFVLGGLAQFNRYNQIFLFYVKISLCAKDLRNKIHKFWVVISQKPAEVESVILFMPRVCDHGLQWYMWVCHIPVICPKLCRDQSEKLQNFSLPLTYWFTSWSPCQNLKQNNLCFIP